MATVRTASKHLVNRNVVAYHRERLYRCRLDCMQAIAFLPVPQRSSGGELITGQPEISVADGARRRPAHRRPAPRRTPFRVSCALVAGAALHRLVSAMRPRSQWRRCGFPNREAREAHPWLGCRAGDRGRRTDHMPGAGLGTARRGEDVGAAAGHLCAKRNVSFGLELTTDKANRRLAIRYVRGTYGGPRLPVIAVNDPASLHPFSPGASPTRRLTSRSQWVWLNYSATRRLIPRH